MAQALDSTELFNYAKELRVPIDLLQKTAELGRLPVVNFAAGGIGKNVLIDIAMIMHNMKLFLVEICIYIEGQKQKIFEYKTGEEKPVNSCSKHLDQHLIKHYRFNLKKQNLYFLYHFHADQ